MYHCTILHPALLPSDMTSRYEVLADLSSVPSVNASQRSDSLEGVPVVSPYSMDYDDVYRRVSHRPPYYCVLLIHDYRPHHQLSAL